MDVTGGVGSEDNIIAKVILDKDSNSQDETGDSSSEEETLPRKKIKFDISTGEEGPLEGVVQQYRCSLELFPEELWELILDKLDDAADIQRALAAFPELDDGLHGKKTTWLFKEVFPFIFNQIFDNVNDVLNIRPVSKRWCSAVDNFLEEHPFKRPYNENGMTRRSVPYREFSYYQPLHDCFPLPSLKTVEDVRSLHDECRGSIRNPFIGRTLEIKRSQDEDADKFLDAVVPLLQEFGHHIWDIGLNFGEILHDEYDDGEEELEASRKSFMKIAQCLSTIPNIRCMSLRFAFFGLFYFQIDNFLCEFPELPNLETIVIDMIDEDDDDEYEDSILKRYGGSGKISQVVVPVSLCEGRDIGFFSSVRDLCFFVDELQAESILAKAFSYCSSNLKRLELLNAHEDTTLDIIQLFKLLESASIQLEELEFMYFNAPSDASTRSEESTGDHVKNIRFLRISDAPGLAFDFLKGLPSLQSVHLHAGRTDNEASQVIQEWKNSVSGEEMTFTALVRCYMYQTHVPAKLDIWREMPSLNLLTFESNAFLVRHARECLNKKFYSNLDKQMMGNIII